MQLHTIHTGFFKLDGGAMFGVVPKSLWNRVQPADENNLCTWAMRCLLIEDAGKLILVDNGIGNKQDAKFLSYYHLHGDDTLDKSLAALGLHRDDITDVFLTHLHFDHCGGSIVREGDRLAPAFKRATYWSHSRHWKWATEPNDREKASFLKENILPIRESGQLRFVDEAALPAPGLAGAPAAGPAGPGGSAGVLTGSGLGGPGGPAAERGGSTVGLTERGLAADAILPGMSVRLVEGHTAAMMLPIVSYKDQTLVFLADLLPSTFHFPMPWIMAYDMFPLTSMNEKRAFLEEAVVANWVLFFEHDPGIECCRAERTEKGIRPGPGFRLSEV